METITRKTLLYKSKVSYADHAINHVLGCAHGCLYPCYAFKHAQRYGNQSGIITHADWMCPRIVENAMDLLEKDLKRIGPKNIKDVHLSFTTDPFMYDYRIGESFAEIEDLTLQILQRLWKDRIITTTLTKGIYPPFDVFESITESGHHMPYGNSYGITLVSISDDFQRKFEPHAAPWPLRLNALENLNNAGLYTWISMEPFPTPYLDRSFWCQMNDMLDMIQFVDKIVFGPWNYAKEVKKYDLENHGDFYSETAAKIKAYCYEREIEFYDKRLEGEGKGKGKNKT